MRSFPTIDSSKITTTNSLGQLLRPAVHRCTGRGKLAMDSTYTNKRVTLHALVIGIDQYKSEHIPNLQGAVSDADAVDEYLRSELHVPAGQIVNLRNKYATRSTILRELQALRTSRTMCRDDPILIYFAGHGATAPAPKDWDTASTRISTIIAYDTLAKDRTGHTICPIPDRTIGAILHTLAETEDGDSNGDNITVILDCCHSGSGTRGLEQRAVRLERGFRLEQDMIPATLDETIWDRVLGDRSVGVPVGFGRSGCRSHVLLAACRESEIAYEERGRGAFTRALLDTLRSIATDSITYRELMEHLPYIPNQTPQCEGHNVDRLLFDARAPSAGHAAYQVIASDGKFMMNAGSAQGVAYGAQFSVYLNNSADSRTYPVAVMAATSVEDFRTELSGCTNSRFLAHGISYHALKVSAGDAERLRLHLPSYKKRTRALNKLVKGLGFLKESGYHAVLMPAESQASLGIILSGSNVEYPIYDSLITSLGLRRLYHTTLAETGHVHSVLRAAARFFWHLHRLPTSSRLSKSLIVQMYELCLDLNGALGRDLRPPFVPRGHNVLHSGTLDAIADDKTAYGISLRSRLNVPLHVWVFFFDCSDLSIIDYYKPPAAGQSGEASLPAHGTLSIGFGADGGLPFKYFLRPNQEMDVGFIKIFVFSEPVDLSGLTQSSAFNISSYRGCNRAEYRPRYAWDTILIPVVQRKDGAARKA